MGRTLVDTREGRFCAVITAPDSSRKTQGDLLYLHGFPDQPETAQPLFDALAREGYRVVAPFLRGYAPSTIDGPFALEQLARDVIAIMDALCHEPRVNVVGHDWGAVLTYALCASAPQRAKRAVTMAVPHPLRFLQALLTPSQLARSWYMLFFQLPFAPELATSALDGKLIDALWSAWSPGFALPPRERGLLHDCLRASNAAPLEYYRAMTRPARAAIARLRGPLAAKITVPTLHLQGARDGCIGPDACTDAHRYFSGEFEQRVIAGAGHFLPQELPAIVATSVIEWLGRGQLHKR